MSKVKMALIVIAGIFCFACGDSSFTDPRDNKVYKTVAIGKQIWMAQNLNYGASFSMCYNDSIAYCEKYGRLYNYKSALTACPSGWHLPSKEEWQTLVDFAGGNKTAGSTLKSSIGWNMNANGTDKYGFAAMPGGLGFSDVEFNGASLHSIWWSASEDNADIAHTQQMYEDALQNGGYKRSLFSVRCVKN